MSSCRSLRIVALAVLVAAGGCSQARFVSVDNSGGVVAIPNNTNRWPSYNRKEAEELMARTCPQGYIVESEGEVVVGHEPMMASGSNSDPPTATLLTFGQHQTPNDRELTEYRIRFHARNAPPPPPPVVEGPPPPPREPVLIAAPTSTPTVTPVSYDLPRAPIPIAPGHP